VGHRHHPAPTRGGWLYCAAVLDAYSRRYVGWSIDSRQDSKLVVNALDMAIRNRRPEPGGIVHADHGTQFTSWVLGWRNMSATEKRRERSISRQNHKGARTTAESGPDGSLDAV
jgi:hypothetical protein